MTNPFDQALDPTTNPVATEIVRLRDEAKPLLIAAAKADIMAQFSESPELVEQVFTEVMARDRDAAQEIETVAVQMGVVTYLEAEHKRRAEWEAGIETRLQEVRHSVGFDRGQPMLVAVAGCRPTSDTEPST